MHERRDAEIDGLIAATHARIAASEVHLESLRRGLTRGRIFVDASLRDMNVRRRALDDEGEADGTAPSADWPM